MCVCVWRNKMYEFFFLMAWFTPADSVWIFTDNLPVRKADSLSHQTLSVYTHVCAAAETPLIWKSDRGIFKNTPSSSDQSLGSSTDQPRPDNNKSLQPDLTLWPTYTTHEWRIHTGESSPSSAALRLPPPLQETSTYTLQLAHHRTTEINNDILRVRQRVNFVFNLPNTSWTCQGPLSWLVRLRPQTHTGQVEGVQQGKPEWKSCWSPKRNFKRPSGEPSIKKTSKDEPGLKQEKYRALSQELKTGQLVKWQTAEWQVKRTIKISRDIC